LEIEKNFWEGRWEMSCRLQRWYIEALDKGRTNEILAKNQDFICEEYLADDTKCNDGKPHQLWVCPDYAFVARFARKRVDWGTKFRIWHQEGNGKIHPHDFAWRI
jgi:hypothetical protein